MKDFFVRSEVNPIITPNKEHDWESHKVFNPGVIFYENTYHLFYRAVGSGKSWRSVLGYAISDDGEHFDRFEEPVLVPQKGNNQAMRGLEDPRITKVGDIFFMTYAIYDSIVPRLCIATSRDLISWQLGNPIFPDFDIFNEGGVRVKWKEGEPVYYHNVDLPEKRNRTKAGAIFPEKIDGKYWMLFNEFRIWMAHSDDGIHWEYVSGPFLSPRENTKFFDNIFVETGAPPIRTEIGWLVLYNGVNDAIQYQTGMLLLDLDDPSRILFRSDEPIFGPKESYELSGIVDIIPDARRLLEEEKEEELKKLLKKAERRGFMPQVTFVSSAVVRGDDVRIFYGAGDQYICTAVGSLKKILSWIQRKKE